MTKEEKRIKWPSCDVREQYKNTIQMAVVGLPELLPCLAQFVETATFPTAEGGIKYKGWERDVFAAHCLIKDLRDWRRAR
ncbi:unnamed protein product [marine sediment metagenome]|uniref:Uncharacterized protein n=1 Tax=marine sediment metagenome TaxID=412755 RepID=X1DCN5_9ZZZZ